MTLSELVDLFVLSRRARGCRARTLDWYEQQFRFLEPILGLQTDEVTGSHLIGLLAAESGLVSAGTLAARWRALRALFNWSEKIHGIGSPMAGVEAPRVPRRQVPHAKIDDFGRLFDALDDDDWRAWRDRAILVVLFWSGLRVSECAALDVGDLDPGGRLVVVRSGKGGDARAVPVAPELSDLVLGYLFRRPPWPGPELWLSWDVLGRSVGGRLTDNGIRQMLKRRCRQAGIEYQSPHKWRHGFAMALLNAGAEMSSISAMLGHSSVKVTEDVYAHWLTEGLLREYSEVTERLRSR